MLDLITRAFLRIFDAAEARRRAEADRSARMAKKELENITVHTDRLSSLQDRMRAIELSLLRHP